MKPWLAALALLTLLLAPDLASACAVCSAGREDENRFAFLIMTIFMSVTPLMLIGGLVYWIRSRFLAQQARDDSLGAPAALAVERSPGGTPQA